MKLSWQARITHFILRSSRVFIRNKIPILLSRFLFEFYAVLQNFFSKKVKKEMWQLDQLRGEWAKINSETKTILYLHGGAYCMGSSHAYRALIHQLAIYTQWNVLAINYRLAPKYSYPAALIDVMAAYQWLIVSGIDATKIILAGDSAGGGLVMSSLLMMKQKKLPLPFVAICFSPWVDLSPEAEKNYPNQDPLLNKNIIQQAAHLYKKNTDAFDPFISPLYGDLSQLPPILIQVSDIEALFQQAIKLKERIEKNNGTVELQINKNLMHAWQFLTWLPESQQALKKVASWIKIWES